MKDILKKKGLGRGLSTLLAETSGLNEITLQQEKRVDVFLPIEKIFPNREQPRKIFNQIKLEELSQSILKNGIIQPVIVRKKNNGYEIIAGERRWRAAQLSKLHEIPAIIRDLSNEQVIEYAIIENIQREDLNPIEEARSYKSLIETYSYTQEEVSSALGKSRSYIANMMRLLTLPDTILDLVVRGIISSGHARALIVLKDPIKAAKKIVSDHLSVRQTEEWVKRINAGHQKQEPRESGKKIKDIDTLNLEQSLSFQTKFNIKIEHSKLGKNGKLIFNYKNLNELDKICEFLYNC